MLTKRARHLLRVCGRRPHRLHGGKAAGHSPLEFDPRQLTTGIKVEREHTTSARVACEIAMDHLVEDAGYYIKLRRIHLD